MWCAGRVCFAVSPSVAWPSPVSRKYSSCPSTRTGPRNKTNVKQDSKQDSKYGKSDSSAEIMWWVDAQTVQLLQRHSELNLSLLHVEIEQTSQLVHVYLHHSFKPQWRIWGEFVMWKRHTYLWWRGGRCWGISAVKVRLLVFANVLFTVSSLVSAPPLCLPSGELTWGLNLLYYYFCLFWSVPNKTEFGCYRKQTYVGNQCHAFVKWLLNVTKTTVRIHWKKKSQKWITFRQFPELTTKGDFFCQLSAHFWAKYTWSWDHFLPDSKKEFYANLGIPLTFPTVTTCHYSHVNQSFFKSLYPFTSPFSSICMLCHCLFFLYSTLYCLLWVCDDLRGWRGTCEGLVGSGCAQSYLWFEYRAGEGCRECCGEVIRSQMFGWWCCMGLFVWERVR